MEKLTIKPISRMATPGGTASFKVRIEDSRASSVRVVPGKGADKYKIQLAGGELEAPVGQGDLVLAIKVPAGAEMA